MLDVLKKYSGYAAVVEPVWVWAYTWVAEHPKTSTVLLLVAVLKAVI